MGRREPFADEPLHPLPRNASLLTPPLENVVPEATDREAEVGQGIPVARHSEVSDMPTHNGLQPLTDFRNRVVHTAVVPPRLSVYTGCRLPLQLEVRRTAECRSDRCDASER